MKRVINTLRSKMNCEGDTLNRKEAVALFTELVAFGQVLPNFVSIEQGTPEKCQLKIKGDYDYQKMEIFLKDKGFSCEKNNECLIIFKP